MIGMHALKFTAEPARSLLSTPDDLGCLAVLQHFGQPVRCGYGIVVFPHAYYEPSVLSEDTVCLRVPRYVRRDLS